MTKPLSWSECDLYLTDKEAWLSKYVYGVKEIPTQAMKRGSDIHAYVLTGGKSAIDKDVYFVNEIRVHERIKEEYKAILPFGDYIPERKMEAEIGGVPTIGFWDASDIIDDVIIELKTGGRLYRQEDAESHGQVYFYALQYQTLFDKIPTVLLVSASTKSGKVIAHEIMPTEEKLKEMKRLIKSTWTDMGKYRDLRICSTR